MYLFYLNCVYHNYMNWQWLRSGNGSGGTSGVIVPAPGLFDLSMGSFKPTVILGLAVMVIL